MKLKPLLRTDLAMVLPAPDSRDALLAELSRRIAEALDEVDAEALRAALVAREEKGPTSTPEGVAFPHAMLEQVSETLVAAAVLDAGVDFQHGEHPPSNVVFVIVGPSESAWQHVSILARLARICHTPGTLRTIRNCRDSDGATLYDVLCAEDARHD